MRPVVSAVIPTYFGRELLAASLPAVLEDLRGCGAPWELLVVEDGSRDGTAELLATRFPEARLLALPENRGFGGACAEGFRAARGSWVYLLNNDMRPRPGCLAGLLDATEPGPEVFAVGPRILHPRAGDRDLGVTGLRLEAGWMALTFGGLPHRRAPLPILYASGGAALYRATLLAELGGFDPLYSPFYYEDVDLSYRAWKRGYQVLLAPAATAEHLSGATIDAHNPPARVARIQARNKLLFHGKNLTDPGPRRDFLVRLLPRLARSLLPGRPPYWAGALAALPRLGALRAGYRAERSVAVRRDREIAEELETRQREAGVAWGGSQVS